ncbi:MAG: hypothetical protein ACE5MH_01680 [Terriglobia bacterium]
MRRADIRERRRLGTLPRTTQIIFGERQSLQNALRLIRSTRLPVGRRRLEELVLRQLIAVRTAELNRLNPDWDRKARLAVSRKTSAAQLQQLERQAPRADYYLLRRISENPRTSAATLARLARHPYAAIRENVARHPNTSVATLRALCRDTREPLWYLVAFNPNTPSALRGKLRARIRRRGLRRRPLLR